MASDEASLRVCASSRNIALLGEMGEVLIRKVV
jgi:hypothetical protein